MFWNLRGKLMKHELFVRRLGYFLGASHNFSLKVHPTAATVRNVNKNLQKLESAYSAC